MSTAATAYGAHAAPEAHLAQATAADNRMVWDRATPGHYEVWYVTLNHLASRTGFWIRYTLEAPRPGHGENYAQLWFACFDRVDPSRTFAFNRRFPIGELRAEKDPFALAIGPNRLTHSSARGELAGAGHTATWDLSWLPAATTHRQLPGIFYKAGRQAPGTVVHTPNLDVPIRGTIEVDGRRLDFDGDPGGQTHLWGKKHAHAWAWGHCNAFDGRRGAALETLTVRLKRGKLVLPPLTVLGLHLDGELLRWNEFQHTLLTRGSFKTAQYRFAAVSRAARVEGEYTCRPDDMILTEYADPDGEPSFCANTEVADLRVTVFRRTARSLGRFREAARLEARGTGHFEVAGREPDPAILRHHVTLS